MLGYKDGFFETQEPQRMSQLDAAARKSELLGRLAPIGQEHLLAFWERLSAPEQQTLARQIDEIDSDRFRDLLAEFRRTAAAGNEASKWVELAARAEPPPAMCLDGRGVRFTAEQARSVGAELVRSSKVGMILVAGGLGTRLGWDQPKGMFPLGPLSNRTLFQILLERLLAVRRRYGVQIPLYVMTSPATDEV